MEVPWTYNVAWGEVVPMPTLWLTPANRMEMPVEEVTLRGFNTPVPWTVKAELEEEALTPATVPLSISTPVPKVVPAVNLAT